MEPIDTRPRGTLLRVLGVGFGLAVIIGNTVGSGILRAPGQVAARLPQPALFLGAWVLGGLYALLGALAMSELGAMMPPSLPAGDALIAALVVALQAVIYTYDGWYGVIYFGEEVRQPARDIPRAMIGGVLLVMLLYLLVNGALIRMLPTARLGGET